MQLFMWQQDIVGLAHYIMVCFMPLVPCLMILMTHESHEPWRLDGCIFPHSLTTIYEQTKSLAGGISKVRCSQRSNLGVVGC